MRRRRLWFGFGAWAFLAAVVVAGPAQAVTVTVHVDKASLLRLPGGVATIVIGNPLIADATLQNGNILVITGKGYGSTNLLALDRKGNVILRRTVYVLGPANHDLIVVYRGDQRETYSCAPECLPRFTLGDGKSYFGDTLGQINARNKQAHADGGGAATK
jgi:hypothetical protein